MMTKLKALGRDKLIGITLVSLLGLFVGLRVFGAIVYPPGTVSITIYSTPQPVVSTNVTYESNYYVFNTNIYGGDTYVSNYFETNVFQDIVMSNYFFDFIYYTNIYETNLTITNFYGGDTYVSNFFDTNIFYNDTYVSNYFYTNINQNILIINTNITFETNFITINNITNIDQINAKTVIITNEIYVGGDSLLDDVTITNGVRIATNRWAGDTNILSLLYAKQFHQSHRNCAVTGLTNKSVGFVQSVSLYIKNVAPTNTTFYPPPEAMGTNRAQAAPITMTTNQWTHIWFEWCDLFTNVVVLGF